MDDEIIIYINGKQIEKEVASILITNDAFLFGFAVFETLRTYKGKFFRLREHLERLKISAEIIKLKSRWALEEIEKQVKDFARNSPWEETRMRVILTKNDLILMTEKLYEKDAGMYKNGVKLIRFDGQRQLPSAKTLANSLSYVANQEAKARGAYDALLVDSQDMVKECAYANIFWVKETKLYTSDKDILKGITRQTVIELAGDCKFEEISYEQLLKADEVFISQTSSGILPVIQIEEEKIRSGLPGKITKELMDQFLAKVWGVEFLL